MPCWVGIPSWIISGVAETIPVEAIVRIRYNGVRLGPAVKIRVVPTGAIMVKANRGHVLLPGILVLGWYAAIGVANFSLAQRSGASPSTFGVAGGGVEGVGVAVPGQRVARPGDEAVGLQEAG